MSGQEKAVDRERCIVWDMLFKHGPMEIGDIRHRAQQHGHTLALTRIQRLVDHPWFIVAHKHVYIATENGMRKTGVMLGAPSRAKTA